MRDSWKIDVKCLLRSPVLNVRIYKDAANIVNISSGDLSNESSSRFQGTSIKTSLLLQIGKAFG